MSARPEKNARPVLYESLTALLHTMRCIELHEPQLCTLLNEIKTSGKVSAKLLAELHAILDKMPGQAYVDDLAAVQLGAVKPDVVKG